MKYYQELTKTPTFSSSRAYKAVDNKAYMVKRLNKMVKKGNIHRIKQGLYTCVDFSCDDDYANRYQIGSSITESSFISYHSAFEFYGFYNQVYYQIQVSSLTRFSNFSYSDNEYKLYLTNNLKQVETIQGVKVSSIERTIVDSIKMLGKVMDCEELVKCLNLVHQVKQEKILEMLETYDQEILYRKVGFVLSFYKGDFSINDDFFYLCKQKGKISNKGYLLSNDKNNLEYNAEWGLYVYKNLRDLGNKGGNEDV